MNASNTTDDVLAQALEHAPGQETDKWLGVQTLELDGRRILLRAFARTKGTSDFTARAFGPDGQVFETNGTPLYVKGRLHWEFQIPLSAIPGEDGGKTPSICICLTCTKTTVRHKLAKTAEPLCAKLGRGTVDEAALARFLDAARADGDRFTYPHLSADGTLHVAVTRNAAALHELEQSLPRPAGTLRGRLLSLAAKHDPARMEDIIRASDAQLRTKCDLSPHEIQLPEPAQRRVGETLPANTLSLFLEQGKAVVDMARWQAESLALRVSHPKLPAAIMREATFSIVLSAKSQSVEFACTPIVSRGNVSWYCRINAGVLAPLAKDGAQAPLKLALRAQWDTATCDVALDSRFDRAAAKGLLGGFFFDGSRYVMPVMESWKHLWLEAGSANGKPARPHPAFPQNPSLENRLLLHAADTGGETLARAAEAVRARTLRTSVTRNAAGVFCRCTAEGLDVELDITESAAAANATLLTEGASYEALLTNTEHEMQFQALYDMIVEFDAFCHKHGIEYFLTAGTLLGAVRGGEFIPWDHDIDVYMKVGEFEKMRRLFAEGHGVAGRVIDCVENDPLYAERLGRYVNAETTRFNPTKPRGHGGIGGAGMFIDIFTLGYLDAHDVAQATDHLYDFLVYEELRNRFDRKHSFRPRAFVVKLDAALHVWDERGYDAALRFAREKMEAGLADGETPYLYPRSGGTTSPYSRLLDPAWYAAAERMRLGDREFDIPQDARDYLRSVYGFDWRVYPANRHVAKDRAIYNSTKVPYRLIVDESLAEVSKEECVRVRSAHKKNALEELVRRAPIDKASENIMQFSYRRRHDKALQAASASLEDAMARNDWPAVDKMFAEFFRQNSIGGWGRLRKEFPFAPADFKAVVLCLLCHRDNVVQAGKLVAARLGKPAPLEPDERYACQVAQDVQALRDLVELGEIDRAIDLIEHLDQLGHPIPFVERVREMLSLTGSHAYLAPEDALKRARARYAAHGNTYDLFIIAEALCALGQSDASFAVFNRVNEECLDAMVLDYVGNKLEEAF